VAFMLALLGLRFSRESAEWMKFIWNWPRLADVGTSPLAALYQAVQPYLARYLQVYYQQYLLIVLPGTIVGDLLLAGLRCRRDESPPAGDRTGPANPLRPAAWSAVRHTTILLLMLGFELLLLIGLQARWLPWTTFVAATACIVGALLFRSPVTNVERLIKSLYSWGVLWLVIGLLFEPYEGGVKKDHATVSYYLITSGLACFALIFFTILIDVFKQRRTLVLLIGSGQNPMIAYAGVRGLLAPALNLTGLEPWLVRVLSTPWLGLLRGGIKAVLLAAFASLCTRLRVLWRT